MIFSLVKQNPKSHYGVQKALRKQALSAAVWTCALTSQCFAQHKTSDEGTELRVSQPSVILVSKISPLTIPNTPSNFSPGLTALEIARIAGQRSGAADILKLDLQARKRSGIARGGNEATESILCHVQAATSFRLRQTAAANAVKLHYAIAACLKATDLFDESDGLLQRQSAAHCSQA